MRRTKWAVLAASGLALAACSQDAPVAPVTRQNSESADRMAKLAEYKSGPLTIDIAFAAKTIGPAGGSLRLLDFEVVVPAGAVEMDTRFTIRVPVEGIRAKYAHAEFGPHGAKFMVPLTLRLPWKTTTSESDTSTRVLWWNGSQWIPFESAPTEDGRIETKTDHFSEYGTEDTTNKGIVMTGG